MVGTTNNLLINPLSFLTSPNLDLSVFYFGCTNCDTSSSSLPTIGICLTVCQQTSPRPNLHRDYSQVYLWQLKAPFAVQHSAFSAHSPVLKYLATMLHSAVHILQIYGSSTASLILSAPTQRNRTHTDFLALNANVCSPPPLNIFLLFSKFCVSGSWLISEVALSSRTIRVLFSRRTHELSEWTIALSISATSVCSIGVFVVSEVALSSRTIRVCSHEEHASFLNMQ